MRNLCRKMVTQGRKRGEILDENKKASRMRQLSDEQMERIMRRGEEAEKDFFSQAEIDCMLNQSERRVLKMNEYEVLRRLENAEVEIATLKNLFQKKIEAEEQANELFKIEIQKAEVKAAESAAEFIKVMQSDIERIKDEIKQSLINELKVSYLLVGLEH